MNRVHQYDTMGLNFSSWAALFANGTIEGIFSFAGNEAAMLDDCGQLDSIVREAIECEVVC